MRRARRLDCPARAHVTLINSCSVSLDFDAKTRDGDYDFDWFEICRKPVRVCEYNCVSPRRRFILRKNMKSPKEKREMQRDKFFGISILFSYRKDALYSYLTTSYNRFELKRPKERQ